MAGRWLDVQQAALELGLSTDAVRKRIARGTLVSEERDGQRVVWLDDNGTEAGQTDQVSSFALIEQLRSENAYLREVVATRDEEIRRRDHIIMSALERVPELESGPTEQEPRQPSENPSSQPPNEESDRMYPNTSAERERSAHKPWWRRILGG